MSLVNGVFNGIEWSIRADGQPDRYLARGKFIESKSGEFRAGVWNGDFGVIRYDIPSQRWVDEKLIWAGTRLAVLSPGSAASALFGSGSASAPTELVNDPIDKVQAQTDGNLVAYSATGRVLAESGTQASKCTLTMQDDGNLTWSKPGQVLWDGRNGKVSYGLVHDFARGGEFLYQLAKEVPGVTVMVAPFEAVVSFGGAIIEGDNVFDAAKKGYDDLKTGAMEVINSPASEMAVSYVANIPGFGTVGGAALSGLIAVAQGKTLTEAGLAAIKGALPGQPLSGKMFDAGLAIAKGQNVLKTALRFGVDQGASYLSKAGSAYVTKALGTVAGGASLSKYIQLPEGVKLPVGVTDIVNLGADAYNQLRAMVPGTEANRGAFDLAINLSASVPDPAIIERARVSLEGADRAAFEQGLALHAGATVGKVAMESGAPQPELSKAVSSLNKRVAMKKAGPAVAGLGVVALGAAFLL